MCVSLLLAITMISFHASSTSLSGPLTSWRYAYRQGQRPRRQRFATIHSDLRRCELIARLTLVAEGGHSHKVRADVRGP
jgi:hypothetical protein